MKIALVCLAKPETGTGNGTTEYSYQLYTRLKKVRGNRVDFFYGMKKSMRYDVLGYPQMWFLLPGEIKKLAKMDYDIIHITMQEIGFVARVLKQNHSKAKVVTTMHDLARLDNRFHKGVFHRSFGLVVKKSIRDAVEYSDFILFNSSQTQRETFAKFGEIKNSKVVWHGSKSSIINTSIPKKKPSNIFTIGYLGALATHKNVISILKVAKLMKHEKGFRFVIYGTGIEYENIKKYKMENRLDNVLLKGFAKEKDLIKIYDSFDVFIMPSMYEGLSHQILEAQARKKPVIVYRNARIPYEITEHCFRARDDKEVVSMIKRLKAKGYDKRMKESAFRFSRKFTWDSTAKETLKVYKSLAG